MWSGRVAIEVTGNVQSEDLSATVGTRSHAPFPQTADVAHDRVELDPVTQTSRYFDVSGRPIEAGKHGTGTDTRPPTGTNLDGKSDSDAGQDGDQD
jgi:putative ATP-grasp target RiPP